ncbi:hypothetical protein GZ77_22410 [Endozoicomonas montiporae]|uniref:DNA-binding protein n=2 Tax=Endozoicomonas montiporae TaxID=1027273 RepID=A0A081N0A4_9GAMM|nr:YheV family putative zinc ribbon protein [Endozoicomonas montiporae]AMO54329.1 hypothetical protein EZMO1_0056 [Endozoicomonas montiporae CL-33]KEQ11877.1 hypothetical protein GZ77_22410 [Endozoicomonas montiporae]
MTIKRFIAGAVCPSCGVQDSVRVFQKKGRDVRECVDCGFSDEVQEKPALVGELPETRISHGDEDKLENVTEDQIVQVVRILDS